MKYNQLMEYEALEYYIINKFKINFRDNNQDNKKTIKSIKKN